MWQDRSKRWRGEGKGSREERKGKTGSGRCGEEGSKGGEREREEYEPEKVRTRQGREKNNDDEA